MDDKEDTNRVGEIEESDPKSDRSSRNPHPNLNTARTKVPEVEDEPRGLGPEPAGGPRHSRQVASNRFTLSIPGRVAAFRSGLTPGTAGLC
ncbi:unnamed protein product [Prunus armeniaca]|uniref:Uncharacterized protein n=1 Tax=Prunus armeniaca TaxID=36596 RepID=A0A6J5VKJ7_PRUAR|nr:unnamed protein product [Prunus armeniaca]